MIRICLTVEEFETNVAGEGSVPVGDVDSGSGIVTRFIRQQCYRKSAKLYFISDASVKAGVVDSEKSVVASSQHDPIGVTLETMPLITPNTGQVVHIDKPKTETTGGDRVNCSSVKDTSRRYQHTGFQMSGSKSHGCLWILPSS
uniref:Uncharacterized protein n=1 Tax=Mesocestoides corti TaxID=53468 RepID=A0A5K3G3A4_MESCO